MDPSTKETVPVFNPTWHETNTDFLTVDSLPIPKVHRAWERQPRSPFNRKGKSRKVWKRYELRSQGSKSMEKGLVVIGDMSPSIAKSPARVVKRLKVKEGIRVGSRKTKFLRDVPSYAATRWDRRKSGLPRKLAAKPDSIEEDIDNTLYSNEDSQDIEVQQADQKNTESEQDMRPIEYQLQISEDIPSSSRESPDRILQANSHIVGASDMSQNQKVSVGTNEEDRVKVVTPVGHTEALVEPFESTDENISNETMAHGLEEPESLGTTTQNVYENEKTLEVQHTTDIDDHMMDANTDIDSNIPSLIEEPSSAHEDSAELTNEDVALLASSEGSPSSPYHHPQEAQEKHEFDIADGLVLFPTDEMANATTPVRSLSTISVSPSKLLQDDFTSHLEDDTAVLMNFLDRAAASKASRRTSISARESFSHRRDSDSIRQALASPRKILENKDPNILSPQKELESLTVPNIPSPKPASPPPVEEDATDESIQEPIKSPPETKSRRSARGRSSRLPHAQTISALPTPNRISMRRADGSDPVVVKTKTEAQELAQMTRNNTKRNKGSAVAASVRLLKLEAEKGEDDEEIEDIPERCPQDGEKAVRWDEQLAYFQNKDSPSSVPSFAPLLSAGVLKLPSSTTIASGNVDGDTNASTENKAKSSTRSRRVKGLGAANGTPGKGLLAPSSLLPAEVQEEREQALGRGSAVPKQRSKIAKLKSADDHSMTTGSPVPADHPSIAPNQTEETSTAEAKQHKSRLATPRRVKIPALPTATSIAAAKSGSKIGSINSLMEGKENRLVAPKKIGLPTPAKVEEEAATTTALPRRKGLRKA